jgi:hypothetical protein
MRYAAAAHLGSTVVTTDADPESLHAATPLAAAKKWYWRLTDAQRQACERIVISAWTKHQGSPWERYEGPDLVYCPSRGWACERPQAGRSPGAPSWPVSTPANRD